MKIASLDEKCQGDCGDSEGRDRLLEWSLHVLILKIVDIFGIIAQAAPDREWRKGALSGCACWSERSVGAPNMG